MEISSLIIPRVEVYWGPVNLTSPSKTPEYYSTLAGSNGPTPIDSESIGPLVYEVRVGMEDQGQTPTGSFKWNPSGIGFQMYEKLLSEYIDYSIIINFYYVGGGYIPFEFYWGGQSDTYGKEMELTVKLVTLMDGLVNANMYATVQTDREEKGRSHKDSVSDLEKQYGIKDFNLIRYTAQASEDTSKSIVKMNYNEGSTFMDAVQNLVKDNGNNVFFNNIERSSAVVFGPYTWEGKKSNFAAVDASTRYLEGTPTVPDPTIRYIYAIAPGIIQSFTRVYEWQPPQKSQEISSMLGRKPQPRRTSGQSDTQTVPDRQGQASRAAATAPQGVYANPSTPNIKSEKNEDGPKKQDLFTKERAAKLSMTTFLCPSLIGIKPLDIILIRTYGSDWVEDWIVNSVEYQQSEGGVDVSIQATRQFGLGEPMVESTVNTFFQGKQLETLLDWERYAWYVTKPPIRLPVDPFIEGSQYTEPPTGTTGLPSVPGGPPAAQPLGATTGPIVTQTGPETFQTRDSNFYSFMVKNLKGVTGVTFTPNADGVGGTVSGLYLENTQIIIDKYNEFQGQSIQPSLTSIPSGTNIQSNFGSSSVPNITSTPPTSSPAPASQAFQALGPYEVKINNPTFYAFLKDGLRSDPVAPTVFGGSPGTVKLPPSTVNYFYKRYVESGGK